MKRLLPNSLSLRLPSKHLEDAYQEEHRQRTRGYLRLALIVGAAQYGLLGLADPVMVPSAFEELRVVRLAVCAVALLGAAATLNAAFQRYQQALTVAVSFVAGLGVIAILVVSDPAQTFIYPFAGLMLVFFFVHVLLQLHFWPATLVSWVLFAVFAWIAMRVNWQSPQIMMNELSFLALANVSGMVASFTIESYSRRLFCQRIALEGEDERKARELEDVRQLQLNMLPAHPPEMKSADIGVFMITATEIGGDYYDFYKHGDGRLTFAIGDATGHGARAGGLVTVTKVLFDSLAEEPAIEDILHRAHRPIQRAGQCRLFMSLAVGRLTDNVLELAGAGIPPALIWRAATGEVDVVPLKGLPLGGPLSGSYSRSVTILEPGDTVVLMTDGFPELFDRVDAMFGYEHVKGLVKKAAGRPAEEVARELRAQVAQFTRGERPVDDVTLLVLRAAAVPVAGARDESRELADALAPVMSRELSPVG